MRREELRCEGQWTSPGRELGGPWKWRRPVAGTCEAVLRVAGWEVREVATEEGIRKEEP